MTWSLNEIETLCRKATRGAGYSWGLAEDAGRAVRWLEAHGYLGAQALAALLQVVDGANHSEMTPAVGAVWQGKAPLCPVITGAALADHTFLLEQGPITLGRTRFPLLLLPYGAMAETVFDIHWDGALGTTEAMNVTCTLTKSRPPLATATRSSIPPGLFSQLDAFAQRTYAPATEASRIKGAGAGLTDND